jgi:hypothetical protein
VSEMQVLNKVPYRAYLNLIFPSVKFIRLRLRHRRPLTCARDYREPVIANWVAAALVENSGDVKV